jgi:hypothetical protein
LPIFVDEWGNKHNQYFQLISLKSVGENIRKRKDFKSQNQNTDWCRLTETKKNIVPKKLKAHNYIDVSFEKVLKRWKLKIIQNSKV